MSNVQVITKVSKNRCKVTLVLTSSAEVTSKVLTNVLLQYLLQLQHQENEKEQK